jgi:sulfite reductase (NADPH) flavoprotein alpha-component
MPRPNAGTPIQRHPEGTAAFDEGQAAARAMLAGLSKVAPLSSEHLEWLSGFVQAFVGATRQENAALLPIADRLPIVAPSAKASSQTPAADECTAYTARIARVEESPVSDVESWLTVTLDVEGSPLKYHPGSTLALWPTNDPEEVRKVLRALGVSAQQQIPTPRGAEPAWQVLLERVNLSVLSRPTVELLAEYSRSESEASGLLDLSEAGAVHLQGRTLLAFLRRFPSTRPPLERLLTTLAALEPAQIPIASSYIDAPNWLQFCARVVERPSGWGEIGSASRSRFRVGEWVTVSVDPKEEPLPVDDNLAPVIVVAEGPCLATARALAAERRAQQAKGRTWVMALGVQASTLPCVQELNTWHKAGSVGRYDVTRSAEPSEVTRLLEDNEETLWRWLVDHSQFCLITTKPELRRAVSEWFVEMLTRRQRLEREAAERRLGELRQMQRFIQLPA